MLKAINSLLASKDGRGVFMTSSDCIGVCIEEPFSGQFPSVKALFPMLGAAVLACELEGLPWTTAYLAKLRIHATGKGNAKKPVHAGCGGSQMGQVA